MTEHVDRHGLSAAAPFADFIEGEALSGLSVTAERFWGGLAAVVAATRDENRALLARRAELQARIDGWHRERAGAPHDAEAYAAFLAEIGYLEPEPAAFSLRTQGVDPEIADMAGPQLVVPISNARYALNAANARWGSLYDALYGTDALGAPPQGRAYDPARGAQVVAWAKSFLDDAAPLAGAAWADVAGLAVRDGALRLRTAAGEVGLADPARFAGYAGAADAPDRVALRNNGLHILVELDAATPVGAADPAGISDVALEAALSSIMDLEDSIAAVDAEDKTAAYRTWLGLMRGDLTTEIAKDGAGFTRRLAQDVALTAPGGAALRLPGRALMLVRNVGHLMTTPTVLDEAGDEVFEGVLDAMTTALIARHDLAKTNGARNSRAGAVYIVKPKMHGPAEVAFADRLFGLVEDALGLPRHTLKMGVMDEERRTSLNLRACIAAAADRLFFINTGFLDRTGDEIHTSMEAGPMVRKGEMKAQRWIQTYEAWNVDVGLDCGLLGRAQIGKGMWAAPDMMKAMLRDKIGHPEAGASCAWVPSPTAATLHATHYHRVDVKARQAAIAAGGPRAARAGLLAIPLAKGRNWDPEEVRAEIENNAQGVLGYVVRWVDQGVGCSKVPDIDDVGLMEDRATCRISAQHIANWLRHGVTTRQEVEAAFRRMAARVDAQNAADPAYRPMAPGFDGPAFTAALALALDGAYQPSGYTEPLLHKWRKAAKAA